ncbi:hypothetical protein [Arcanobacterium sp. S3PF19]|uniref:hypothetical protein n=1 Tax=Arcanobacterium sp. S3PF19 TaxID=1219585 RepID=UPI00050EA908|nr:hypothetical protein [Arcanobacterium sp. S3PF19]KGF05646.1 hypothetical protein HMPREF1631_05145 [Arcanobacterium sp. S3PF19]
MRGDNGIACRLPKIQLWIIATLSVSGIIALAYGRSKQSDPGILAILLLLYGGVLPLIVMAFTLMRKVGLKQRALVFPCCLLMSVTALSFAFFGETIAADFLGIVMVSYLFWPGREINFALSILSIVLCMGITLWQYSRRQS